MKIIGNLLKLFVIIFCLCHIPAKAQESNNNYRVYAGLLYHFTKYIEWPSQKQQGDFVIGVYGDEEMVVATQNLTRNRFVSNQRIIVKKVVVESDINECHIIFVERKFSHKFKTIQPKMQSQNTLLITESGDFAKKGAGINFVIKQDRLKFEMNKSVIEGAGLRVSNELVKLSILVG
ncbi:MAG: YfiR family protein [Thermoflexibacter sp.]|jgi:hypothetical protein|nr:YfiR family protein [Thermoflexibacter sp.]